MAVTFTEDEFTRALFLTEPRWVVKLDNGQTVIDDEGRESRSSWLRLRDYVTINNLRIEQLALQFRNNVVHPVPPKAEGYFFRRAAAAFLNDGITFNYFLVGYLRNGELRISKYDVPSLTLVKREIRDPQTVGESLIV